MTTWKDGGNYGLLCREITNETGDHAICKVWTKQYTSPRSIEPWPEGKANFRLILKAPQMLEVLKEIRAKANLMMKACDGSMTWADWQAIQKSANAAITISESKNE